MIINTNTNNNYYNTKEKQEKSKLTNIFVLTINGKYTQYYKFRITKQSEIQQKTINRLSISLVKTCFKIIIIITN